MPGSTTPGDPSSEGEEYVIRPFEVGDAGDVRALYERVWGTPVSESWLTHRYLRAPSVDAPTMMVAAVGDDVVGARPLSPFPVRDTGVETVGLYLSDLMVHPDHRRQGLFTRMMTRLLDAHADGAAAFTLNDANELSAPGYRKMGFTEVGSGPGHSLRVQRPGQLLRDRFETPFARPVGALADLVTPGYLAARRVRGPSTGSYRVERRTGVAADTLTRLYDRNPPARLHLRREPAFYRWPDGHPGWTHETYVAHRDGTPEAAIVVQQRRESDSRAHWLVDAAPLPTGDTPDVAFTALLDAVTDAHAAAAALTVSSPVYERLLPKRVRSWFGFHSSFDPVLSRFASLNDGDIFVYPLTDGARGGRLRLGEFDLRNPESWQIQIH